MKLSSGGAHRVLANAESDRGAGQDAAWAGDPRATASATMTLHNGPLSPSRCGITATVPVRDVG